MAGTRAPFASLAALAVVASAQGEQAGTAAESAKKDLQSLPTVQRPVEATTGKSLFSGGAAVPGLTIGTTPAPGASQGRESAAPGKTANWLLDGVNQLEAEAKAQREANEAAVNGKQAQESPTGNRFAASTSATTNPFTEYLTQWLSPADQALVQSAGRSGGQTSTAPWEMPRSDFSRETAPTKQAAANPLQMELPGISDFPSSRTTQNPYLAEALQTENAIIAAKAGVPDGRGGAALPSILTPSQTMSPPVAPAPAPIEQARASSSVAAPTERLIDDRKYFPQLRRF